MRRVVGVVERMVVDNPPEYMKETCDAGWKLGGGCARGVVRDAGWGASCMGGTDGGRDENGGVVVRGVGGHWCHGRKRWVDIKLAMPTPLRSTLGDMSADA